MAAKKFGYVRVSTREQNPERQIYILRDEEGIDERDIVVRQIKRGHIRQIKSGLIHGNCQKTVGLSSLISSDYKKKKLPMQIKTQAVS